MKTILVTGGAGFIGSNFVKYIWNKYPEYKIIVLDALTYAGYIENFPANIKDDSRFSFWHANILNSDVVNELVEQSDIVVHFAAESHVARSIYDNKIFFETDVMGTQVLANAILRHGVERFVHISTSEVYGTAASVPMDENHPLNPTSPYAAAKTGADRLIYSYCETYNIPAVILRPFNNYGPNQHLEKAIPAFITNILRKRPVEIHGNGLCSRDWLYVEDNCRAIDAAMHVDIDSVKGEVINIGTGKDYSVLDIARKIIGKMGTGEDLLCHIPDRPGQVVRHIASTGKARELLGWEATTDIETGLDRTVEWYSSNIEWWEKMTWLNNIPIRDLFIYSKKEK